MRLLKNNCKQKSVLLKECFSARINQKMKLLGKRMTVCTYNFNYCNKMIKKAIFFFSILGHLSTSKSAESFYIWFSFKKQLLLLTLFDYSNFVAPFFRTISNFGSQLDNHHSRSQQRTDQRVLILTMQFFDLKKLPNFPKLFKLFFTFIQWNFADTTIFSKTFLIYFLPMKT